MKLKIALAALPVLFGCATQQALMTETPSGHPEVTFERATLTDVQNALIARCSQIGGMVSEQNTNTVTCSGQLQGQQAVMAQLLLGNSYSTTPVRKVRFVMDANGDSVHVVAFDWVETTMAMGQVHSAEMSSNNSRNALQESLDRLKGKFEDAHPKPKHETVAGDVIHVTAYMCSSYDQAGAGNRVKHYQKGDSLTVYARNTIYDRISANGAPQEWIVDGSCTQ
ncbi:hypothetical protein [Paraburkholderia sp. Ac-20340]|uniref:hypothetical protein n=1 Tax=Paraburkholderia sp. Ac-20340 TaxID=2703888 RepID=UPI00197F6E0F|nr:hypothetical protein [Paraburkholderia sp. Ac-20340]